MISMIMIITTVFLIALSLCIYMFIRIEQVYNIREDILNRQLQCLNNRNMKEHQRLNTLYNKYTYEEMLFKIWKSPNSFYSD